MTSKNIFKELIYILLWPKTPIFLLLKGLLLSDIFFSSSWIELCINKAKVLIGVCVALISFHDALSEPFLNKGLLLTSKINPSRNFFLLLNIWCIVQPTQHPKTPSSPLLLTSSVNSFVIQMLEERLANRKKVDYLLMRKKRSFCVNTLIIAVQSMKTNMKFLNSPHRN